MTALPDDDRPDEVRIEHAGSFFATPTAGPHGADDDGVQQLDPNAWSLNFEARAREEDARLAHLPEPEEVGPDAWFVEAGDLLSTAYCVSLVRAVDIDEAFSRLGAREVSTRTIDLDTLVEEAYEQDDERYQVLGAATVGAWTLVLGPNAYSPTFPELKSALSAGTTLVTFYSNVNATNELSVTVDGVNELTFDMMLPADRSGDEVGRHDSDLIAAGFLLDEDAAGDDDVRWEVAGAALVERLAGLRLSVGLLAGLRWRTGLIE